MQSVHRDVEYAEYLLEAAKQIPQSLIGPTSSAINPKGKSLHQKLVDLYVEESGRQPLGKSLVYASNLLQKLVKRDRLHCVVLNLYHANEGYSLLLRGRNGVETETIKLPYEESELLEYIDASELPPVLVDLLEKARVNVFYSGCVIVEVRDYRRSATGNVDSVYVLLRPTAQSLLADLNAMTSDGRKWSQDDQYMLESQMLLETEEPLCLDPSPAVFLVTNKLQYERKKFNTPLLKRSVKKYSQAAVNRKRKFAQGPAPKELQLYDFLHRKKDKPRPQLPVNLKVGKASVDMWKQRSVHLSVPESVETQRYAKPMEKPKQTSDNIPVIAEEYVLERESTQGKTDYYKVTVYRRPSDFCYIGELYMDHDYVENQLKGSVCRFNLGTKANVDKYIQQLTEIFTEGGRLKAKITRTVAGHPPQVSVAQPQSGTSSSHGPAANSHTLVSQAANLSSTINAQGDYTAGKKNKPLQLSTSLTSSANLISPQSTPTLTSPVGLTNSQLTNQMTVNIQHPLQQATGQPQMASRHRHSSRPMSTPSPVSTPTSLSAQLPSYTQAIASQPSVTHKPPSIPTPPPLVKTPNPRRSSITDAYVTSMVTTQGTDGNLASSSVPPLTPQSVAPNVNIANIPGLATNINIQNLANLQGVNIANLQGLQNMQVSLTGVSVPGGGIAVPVPINMINTSPSLLQNQGIIVSSLPNQTSSAGNTSTTTSQISTTPVTSPTTYVTMVTALPASTATSTSVTSSSVSTAVSSGVLTNPTSVMTGPQHSMLQLPINVAGNLTQFMPHLKTTTVRGHTGLSLVQLQGQQSIQLLNLQQPQRLQPQLHQSSSTTNQGHQAGSTTTSSPLPVTTAVLSGQTLSGQSMANLAIGKQQFLQLAAAQPQAFQPQPLQQLQQLPRQIQFQPMPQAKHTAASSSSTKSKSKKRATPTPPKN
ncbi:transcription factor SPT20 homolog isoform X1 [Liolophura sinensis]|uniref:transcription factor SPT20 homolog isoform X1 n=1 Tax=Liolophura sinensis TaxID=3198878 RepID=UPI0031592289